MKPRARNTSCALLPRAPRSTSLIHQSSRKPSRPTYPDTSFTSAKETNREASGAVFSFKRKNPTATTRLITARSGRIDSSAEKSELVLSDAVQTKLPAEGTGDQEYVVERLDQLRILFNTGRNDLISRLQRTENKADEMEFRALRQFLSQTPGPQTSRSIVSDPQAPRARHLRHWFSPSSARFWRCASDGAGAASARSLRSIVMVIVLFVVIAGEQMTRGGTLPPVIGGWLATSLVLIFAVILLRTKKRFSLSCRSGRLTDRLIAGRHLKTAETVNASPFVDHSFSHSARH